MNRNLSFAYGPRGVAHLVEYAGNRQPAPYTRPVEAPMLWESICGYRVRFAYPELRLAGHPDGDGAACDERGWPVMPWCSRCAGIAAATAATLLAGRLTADPLPTNGFQLVRAWAIGREVPVGELRAALRAQLDSLAEYDDEQVLASRGTDHQAFGREWLARLQQAYQ